MTAAGEPSVAGPLRRALLPAAVIVHVLFVIAPLDVLAPVDSGAIADRMLSGDIPYRDFQFEYPPLAAVLFLPSGLVPDQFAVNVLALQAVVLEVVMVALVLRRRPGALRRYALLSILVFPFLSGGFDAVVMVTLAISTDLLARHDRKGWSVAALGVAVKIAPASTWVWARARLGTGFIVGGLAAAVAVSPLVLVGLSADSWIGYSRERGVQAESVAASVAWVAKRIDGSAVEFEYRMRSWELLDAATAGHVMLGIGAVGLAIIAWRSRASVDPWIMAYAAILAFMVGNKVLSPQFLAWPAGLVAVIGGRWFVAHVVLCALTSLVYVGDGDLAALSPLIAGRNALLVVVTVAAIVVVVRQSAIRPTSGSQHVDSVTT